MDRLTNKNVDVEPINGALGEYEHAYIPGIKERFLKLILNGPTLNGVNKDLLRSIVRQLYKALKQYEDAEEQGRWIRIMSAEEHARKIGAKTMPFPKWRGSPEKSDRRVLYVPGDFVEDIYGDIWKIAITELHLCNDELTVFYRVIREDDDIRQVIWPCDCKRTLDETDICRKVLRLLPPLTEYKKEEENDG